MNRAVIFLPEARVEVIEAQHWYAAKAIGLGAEFRGQFERIVERLAGSPTHFPIVERDVRRARLFKFPYALYFRAMPDRIVVLACFHSRRDPQALQGRN